MILSVSRRTDIPAFYSEWFFNRVKEGYLMVRNPMSYHQVSKIPLDEKSVDCFVFWTKNPSNMLPRLDEIKRYNYYFLFTITSYNETVELNVPKKLELIDTYKRLADTIGKDRVVWRYDPILLSGKINEEYHYKYFEVLASKLTGYAGKCVISYLDTYKKCERNMKQIGLSNIDTEDMLRVSKKLNEIATSFNIRLASCAEEETLEKAGIAKNKCIDPELVQAIASKDVIPVKDKSQRDACGCISSIDVGSYNTCNHNCLYCYANFSFNSVINNSKKHNPDSPLLIGELENTDKVTVRKMDSCFGSQGAFRY